MQLKLMGFTDVVRKPLMPEAIKLVVQKREPVRMTSSADVSESAPATAGKAAGKEEVRVRMRMRR